MNEGLAALVKRIVEGLPAQVGPLLDDPRFVRGRAAIDRLRDPPRREAAVAALSEREAAWLLDELCRRSELLGPLEGSPPGARLVVEPAGQGAPSGAALVRLADDGLEEPVRVRWEGATAVGPRAARVTLGLAATRVVATVDARRGGVRSVEVFEVTLPPLPWSDP